VEGNEPDLMVSRQTQHSWPNCCANNQTSSTPEILFVSTFLLLFNLLRFLMLEVNIKIFCNSISILSCAACNVAENAIVCSMG